jgi:flagellar FliJ protein
MKFKFPLQKVMDHRKTNQNLAQKDFQVAALELAEQQDALEKMQEEEHQAHLHAGKFTQQGGALGAKLVQIHEFLIGQKVRISHQKTKIIEIEKLVESKREILRLASQEYKIMEKMRENKFEAYRAARILQDQKEMDEQSILRFKNVKEI